MNQHIGVAQNLVPKPAPTIMNNVGNLVLVFTEQIIALISGRQTKHRISLMKLRGSLMEFDNLINGAWSFFNGVQSLINGVRNLINGTKSLVLVQDRAIVGA